MFPRRFALITFLLLAFSGTRISAQTDTLKAKVQSDYQIFLKHPAKEIRHILYDKNYLPIHGQLSEDRKALILKNYEPGNKVRFKIVYEDGTEEEILKSPCYIDPVIL